MSRLRISTPKRSKSRVAQLRLRLIKNAARVVEMKTTIRMHLPTSCPAQDLIRFPTRASLASSHGRRGVSSPSRAPRRTGNLKQENNRGRRRMKTVKRNLLGDIVASER